MHGVNDLDRITRYQRLHTPKNYLELIDSKLVEVWGDFNKLSLKYAKDEIACGNHYAIMPADLIPSYPDLP